MTEKKMFEVLTRGGAEKFKSDVPWAAISITTEPPWPELSEENRVGLLQLEFLDAEFVRPSHKWGAGLHIFDEADAVQILDFVQEMWPEVECFMVHCAAGISRSPAVAAAIEKIYYDNDSYWFNTRTPNMLVYRNILNVYHEKYSETAEES
jgi:protein-tyrosine phosphatase